MSYRQPPPSARRLALLERRPRRLGDINWREIIATISWSGAAYLPVAVAAWFLLGAFARTPLGWLPSYGLPGDLLVVFAAAGVGYLWFRMLGGLLVVVVWLVFFVSRTPVRQDWVAGFLAGATAVIATLPLAAGRTFQPLEFSLGPLLAILLTQPPTAFVATRELKRFVRTAWWSADDQLLVDRKSLNLQISLASLFGVMTVASLAMGLMRASGLLEQPVSRALITGVVLQVALLPGSVWLAHRLLGGSKRDVPREQPKPEPQREETSKPVDPWS